jgi:nucleoside triphosphate diphosphatase
MVRVVLSPSFLDLAMDPSRDVARLLEIMAALRTPGTGCPWDLEQTFETIAPYTIEEAYEVADAIARSDLDDLRDELGDLLLQVVFHARMAQERGAFDFADVVERLTAKLVRRHPHVLRSRACGNASRRRSGPKRPASRTARRAPSPAFRSRSLPSPAR